MQQSNQKRGVFTLKQEPKQLSNAQCFLKLYYLQYKKSIKARWQEAYLAHYKCVMEDSAEIDVKALAKQVSESIRKDLQARLLNITVTATSEGDDDVGKGEDDEDGNDGCQEVEDLDDDSHKSVIMPKVAVWYWNAVVGNLWANATPSQQDAVKWHRQQEEEGEETDEDLDNELEDGEGAQQKQVKQLQEVITYVIYQVW
jgi:hypothetical protein